MSQKTAMQWDRKTTPAPVSALLETLMRGGHVPSQGQPLTLRFVCDPQASQTTITPHADGCAITYGRLCDASRAIGSLLAGLGREQPHAEKTVPRMFGVMLDCSRNAVFTVEHVCRWLERLALLGFNTAMLYTEDTYRLPEEPYFGYGRGAYSAQELRAIDEHAAALGIEMIACFQTLGHLGQVLKWWPYDAIRDVDGVLLVDEEKTYALIDKMLGFWASTYRSRRVHLGMDEAIGLGRGRYDELHGSHNAHALFARHLERVTAMCRAHGLEPMIWSDMLFRTTSESEEHYRGDAATGVGDLAAKVGETRLVYWDYYGREPDGYLQRIARHRAMGFEPIVASAVMTAYRFWYDHAQTHATALPCLEACRQAGIEEILLTMWGDDGACCDFDSALAGLALVAEHALAVTFSQEQLEDRFQAICQASYGAHRVASGIHQVTGIHSAAMLWDDPLLGIYMRSRDMADPGVLTRAAAHYEAIARQLAPFAKDSEAGDLGHAGLLARTLAAKTALADQLYTAHEAKDRPALLAVTDAIAPMRSLLGELSDSFRRLWLKGRKPAGLEVVQIRLAGLDGRYAELQRRLSELSDDQPGPWLVELEEPVPGRHGYAHYHRLATASGHL